MFSFMAMKKALEEPSVAVNAYVPWNRKSNPPCEYAASSCTPSNGTRSSVRRTKKHHDHANERLYRTKEKHSRDAMPTQCPPQASP
jgi:hypothetical protein